MPIRHTVKEGDCIASIAAEYGFFPDTLWNDPANKDLRERRASPYILAPGDTVAIPEKRIKQIEKPASQKHRFRRKGVPATLQSERLLTGPEQGLARRRRGRVHVEFSQGEPA